MDHGEFGRQLDELRDLITWGVGSFTAWHELANLDDDSAHALSRYRGFFSPAQRAFLEMALLQFSKVYDKNTPISLRNLLKKATANPKILVPLATQQDLQDLAAKIDGNHDLLKRLKNRRNKRIAHHDWQVTADTSMRYGEFKQLVSDTIDMYNSLSKWHGRSFTSLEGIERQSRFATSEVKRLMSEEMARAQSVVAQYHANLDQDG